MTKSSNLYVGMDAHKDSIDIALTDGAGGQEVPHCVSIGGDLAALEQAFMKLQRGSWAERSEAQHVRTMMLGFLRQPNWHEPRPAWNGAPRHGAAKSVIPCGLQRCHAAERQPVRLAGQPEFSAAHTHAPCSGCSGSAIDCQRSRRAALRLR